MKYLISLLAILIITSVCYCDVSVNDLAFHKDCEVSKEPMIVEFDGDKVKIVFNNKNKIKKQISDLEEKITELIKRIEEFEKLYREDRNNRSFFVDPDVLLTHQKFIPNCINTTIPVDNSEENKK